MMPFRQDSNMVWTGHERPRPGHDTTRSRLCARQRRLELVFNGSQLDHTIGDRFEPRVRQPAVLKLPYPFGFLDSQIESVMSGSHPRRQRKAIVGDDVTAKQLAEHAVGTRFECEQARLELT